MTRAATEYERADHDRDLRKHDPLPLHAQSAPIAGALEVAILVQAVPLVQGAELIERYAMAAAAAARLDAVSGTIDRCCAAIDAWAPPVQP